MSDLRQALIDKLNQRADQVESQGRWTTLHPNCCFKEAASVFREAAEIVKTTPDPRDDAIKALRAENARLTEVLGEALENAYRDGYASGRNDEAAARTPPQPRPPARRRRPLAAINWHGPAEEWTWPLTDEQWARVNGMPCMRDGGIIQVMGVGPYVPDLVVNIMPDALRDALDGWQDGDSVVIRFGEMTIDDFANLPEHGGW